MRIGDELLTHPLVSVAAFFAYFVALAPSWWALIAVAVRMVFIPVALLPALIVVVTRVSTSLLLFISFVSVMCRQGRPTQGQCGGQSQCSQ
jgi:hypothetical protein